MISIRPANLPADALAIERIDTSFTTAEVYEIEATPIQVGLRLRRLVAPLRKQFPLDALRSASPPYTDAWVAALDGAIVGFAASSFDTWNRRLVLWHFYVDPPARGRGVGRRLIETVKAHGLECSARHIWLETSSLNVPGVAVYSALGFRLTGLDLTLYDGTPSEGEVALFYSQELKARAAA